MITLRVFEEKSTTIRINQARMLKNKIVKCKLSLMHKTKAFLSNELFVVVVVVVVVVNDVVVVLKVCLKSITC